LPYSRWEEGKSTATPFLFQFLLFRLPNPLSQEFAAPVPVGSAPELSRKKRGLSRPRPESHQQLYEFRVADIKARYQLWKSCGSLKTRAISIWGKFDPCAKVMAQCGGRSKSTAVRDLFY